MLVSWCGARARRCSSPLVLVGACARVIVRCSYPSVLLLVRYSSSGRAATRPLLVRRPCCYSSATRPAAVLLLVRYSSGGRAATRPLLVRRPCCYSPATRPAAVLLLVRYSSGGRAATRPLLVRRPCCYSSATRPAAVLLARPRPCCYSSATRPVVVQKNSRPFLKATGFTRYTHAPRWSFLSGKPLADPRAGTRRWFTGGSRKTESCAFSAQVRSFRPPGRRRRPPPPPPGPR